MRASILDFRKRMKEILRALDQNEPVTILYRGKPKGVIYPFRVREDTCPTAKEHPAFGIWNDRDDLDDVSGFVDRVRKGRFGAV